MEWQIVPHELMAANRKNTAAWSRRRLEAKIKRKRS
jgi:hypothetical protein